MLWANLWIAAVIGWIIGGWGGAAEWPMWKTLLAAAVANLAIMVPARLWL